MPRRVCYHNDKDDDVRDIRRRAASTLCVAGRSICSIGRKTLEQLDTYLTQLARSLAAIPRDSLAAVAQALWETYERDGTIIICGNGGSAATASHFACDLAKWTICPDRRRLRALALTDNVPLMTAWSNDRSYESLFVE